MVDPSERNVVMIHGVVQVHRHNPHLEGAPGEMLHGVDRYHEGLEVGGGVPRIAMNSERN